MTKRSRKPNGDPMGSEERRIKSLEAGGDVDALISEIHNPKEDLVDVRGKPYAVAVRGHAARALGRLGDPRALEPLKQLLSDPQFTVRQDASTALADLGDTAAVPALIERLTDPDWYVRHHAARALGTLGDPAAVPDLTSLLSSEHWALRLTGADALAKIGDPAAVEPLKRATRRERPWHWYRRARLARALRLLRSRS